MRERKQCVHNENVFHYRCKIRTQQFKEKKLENLKSAEYENGTIAVQIFQNFLTLSLKFFHMSKIVQISWISLTRCALKEKRKNQPFTEHLYNRYKDTPKGHTFVICLRCQKVLSRVKCKNLRIFKLLIFINILHRKKPAVHVFLNKNKL